MATLIVGCSTRPVKTETVTVYVPVKVGVDSRLSSPVPYPAANIVTNDDLAKYAIALREALKQANPQLDAIKPAYPEKDE